MWKWLRPVMKIKSGKITPGIGSVSGKRSKFYDSRLEHKFGKQGDYQNSCPFREMCFRAKSVKANGR